MQVRLRTIMCGPTVSAEPGQIIDLPEGQARELIEAKFATQPGAPDDQPPRRRGKRETATRGAAETAQLV